MYKHESAGPVTLHWSLERNYMVQPELGYLYTYQGGTRAVLYIPSSHGLVEAKFCCGVLDEDPRVVRRKKIPKTEDVTSQLVEVAGDFAENLLRVTVYKEKAEAAFDDALRTAVPNPSKRRMVLRTG